jgi:DNA-binding NarL/FixJ family response regulator
MPITVLLADDTEIMRNAVRRLLESEPGIEIVGETADFDQTIKLLTDLRPHVVVMDLSMPAAFGASPSAVKNSFAASASRLLLISIWDDEDSKALAAFYGSAILLNKRNLEEMNSSRQLNAKSRSVSRSVFRGSYHTGEIKAIRYPAFAMPVRLLQSHHARYGRRSPYRRGDCRESV